MKIPKTPIFSLPDRPLYDLAQKRVPVAEITKDIVLYKDGGAALVLESTSLNFGLLSEREQEAVVAAYAALINSLSFSIQILVRTQKKDVSQYLEKLESRYNQIENPKLKNLMQGYKSFIADTIKKKNVLGKRFFIVIPFSPLELGISKNIFGGLKADDKPIPYSKIYIMKKVETALLPKRDHLIRQAGRLGLKLHQLSNEELIKLFYDTYNPDHETIKVEKAQEEEIESNNNTKETSHEATTN